MTSIRYKRLIIRKRCELMTKVESEGTSLWDKRMSCKFCDIVTRAYIKGNHKAEHSQVGAVLDYIERRQYKNFHLFVQALNETRQAHVVQQYLIPSGSPESTTQSQPVPTTTVPTSVPIQETSVPTVGSAATTRLAPQIGDLRLAQETGNERENGIRICPRQFYEDRKTRANQKTEHSQVGPILDCIERRPDQHFHLCVQTHVIQNLITSESTTQSQPLPATTVPTSIPIQETSVSTVGSTRLAPQMGDLRLAQETGHERENGIRRCPKQFYEERKTRPTVYNMRRKVKGNALIMNNYSVKGQPRPGSDKDLEVTQELFKDLQFNVWILKDLMALDIGRELKKFAMSDDASTSTCCFVVLMSHGEKDGILGEDGEIVPFEHIWELFSDECSPGYKGKPKVFVNNACQINTSDLQTVRLRHKDASPAYPDMFMAYSTTPGHGSIRDREQGSWYIQEMVKVFREEAADTSVQSLFDKVGGEVRKKISERGETQQPETRSRLNKEFFLFPGRYDYE